MADNVMLTASRVAGMLDISVRTLTNWYKWYNDPNQVKPKDCPKLPQYMQKNKNSPRYWTRDAVYEIEKFRDWVPKGRNGVMGRVNEQYWSKTYRDHKAEDSNNE